MNSRTELERGYILPFPGMQCCIDKTLGMGSNAIVYAGWYRDHLHHQEKHHVLIKELFPYHAQGMIRRNEHHQISVEGEEASALFMLHKESFEAGNRIHLQLLRNAPESLGANLNSYEYNGTLYTVLGCSGGRSLHEELTLPSRSHDLRSYTKLMLKLLDALEAFHDNGYLHLDISPDNMLLIGKTGQEHILLIDYNSARKIEDFGSSWLSCKAGYSSPEVEMNDQESICEASDLYSVTAVFFRCLMKRPLTLEEMLQPNPPDAHDSVYLKDAPQTVVWQVGSILRRGLCSVVEDRYQSIAALRKDLDELMDRINCVGITHWSLWEGGKRSVNELIRTNPSLRYIKNDAELFPLRLEYGGQCYDLPDFLCELLGGTERSALMISSGGMGKTTALLKAALIQNKTYHSKRTAAFYLSLSGRCAQDPQYIRSQLLTYLRFKRNTATFATAMHELELLLNRPLCTRFGKVPAVLLLLDGLNEVQGDPKSLYEEIRMLSRLRGVCILASSRSTADELALAPCSMLHLSFEDIEKTVAAQGILLPRDEELLALMKTPLILSLYLKAAQNRQQFSISGQNDLIQAYLKSLYHKEMDKLPENAPEKWRIAAAMEFVLPAIAAQSTRDGNALSREEMLQVVEACYSTLRAGYFDKVFPNWIGHSRDILGACTTAEEWYGPMIDDLLWQRLGLLIIDGEGRYRVFHQIIRDSLIPRHKENAAHIRRCRLFSLSLLALPVTLVLLVAFGVYAAFFMVTPYDDVEAEIVLAKGQEAYNQYFSVFEELYTLLEIVENEQPVYLRYQPGNTQEHIIARALTPFETQYSNVYTALSEVDQKTERLKELENLAVQERKIVSWSDLVLDTHGIREMYGFIWGKKIYYKRTFLPQLKRWYSYSNLSSNPDILSQENTFESRCYQAALEMAKLDALYCMLLYEQCISVHLTSEQIAKYAMESAYFSDRDLKSMLFQEQGEKNLALLEIDIINARSRWDDLMSVIEERPYLYSITECKIGASL